MVKLHAVAAREEPSPGDILDSKYRVERILGVGGMGMVVAATHLELNEVVAIKFLREGRVDGRDAVVRFQREARAVAKLRSDHVVRVRDVGTLGNGLPFMVMDLLEGETLKDLVKRAGPLPWSQAVAYLLQACDAVAEAHAQGIIHRDLKPTNLFLSRKLDGRPIVKVFDFGISKLVHFEPVLAGQPVGDLGLTSTTTMLGSPLYMAPEQMVSSRDVDARADIWSLGVSLFFLVTGRLPFEAESVMQVFSMVLGEPPPRVDAIHPEIPGGLADVIACCLRKDPAERYPSVLALAQALESFAVEASNGANGGVFINPRASGVEFVHAEVRREVTATDPNVEASPALGIAGHWSRRWSRVAVVAVLVVSGLVAMAWRVGTRASLPSVTAAAGSGATAPASSALTAPVTAPVSTEPAPAGSPTAVAAEPVGAPPRFVASSTGPTVVGPTRPVLRSPLHAKPEAATPPTAAPAALDPRGHR